MKKLKIKAVILTDGEHYLIHGSDEESPQQMFKAISPIWDFDPSKEIAHYAEIEILVPIGGEVEVHHHDHHPSHDDLPLTLAKDDPHREPDRMELTLDDFKLR